MFKPKTEKMKILGLIIFDIQKIRNFICWKKEIEENIKTRLNAKRIPQVGPLSSRVNVSLLQI